MDKRMMKLMRLGVAMNEAEILIGKGIVTPKQIREMTTKDLKAMGVKEAKKKVTR